MDPTSSEGGLPLTSATERAESLLTDREVSTVYLPSDYLLPLYAYSEKGPA